MTELMRVVAVAAMAATGLGAFGLGCKDPEVERAKAIFQAQAEAERMEQQALLQPLRDMQSRENRVRALERWFVRHGAAAAPERETKAIELAKAVCPNDDGIPVMKVSYDEISGTVALFKRFAGAPKGEAAEALLACIQAWWDGQQTRDHLTHRQQIAVLGAGASLPQSAKLRAALASARVGLAKVLAQDFPVEALELWVQAGTPAALAAAGEHLQGFPADPALWTKAAAPFEAWQKAARSDAKLNAVAQAVAKRRAEAAGLESSAPRRELLDSNDASALSTWLDKHPQDSAMALRFAELDAVSGARALAKLRYRGTAGLWAWAELALGRADGPTGERVLTWARDLSDRYHVRLDRHQQTRYDEVRRLENLPPERRVAAHRAVLAKAGDDEGQRWKALAAHVFASPPFRDGSKELDRLAELAAKGLPAGYLLAGMNDRTALAVLDALWLEDRPRVDRHREARARLTWLRRGKDHFEFVGRTDDRSFAATLARLGFPDDAAKSAEAERRDGFVEDERMVELALIFLEARDVSPEVALVNAGDAAKDPKVLMWIGREKARKALHAGQPYKADIHLDDTLRAAESKGVKDGLAVAMRQQTTGDVAWLDKGIAIIRGAAKNAPDAPWLKIQLAVLTAHRGLLAVLDKWVDVKALRLSFAEAMDAAVVLADSQLGKEVAAAITAEPRLQTALRLLRAAEEPERARSIVYHTQLLLHQLARNRSALSELHHRIRRADFGGRDDRPMSWALCAQLAPRRLPAVSAHGQRFVTGVEHEVAAAKKDATNVLIDALAAQRILRELWRKGQFDRLAEVQKRLTSASNGWRRLRFNGLEVERATLAAWHATVHGKTTVSMDHHRTSTTATLDWLSAAREEVVAPDLQRLLGALGMPRLGRVTELEVELFKGQLSHHARKLVTQPDFKPVIAAARKSVETNALPALIIAGLTGDKALLDQARSAKAGLQMAQSLLTVCPRVPVEAPFEPMVDEEDDDSEDDEESEESEEDEDAEDDSE